MDLTSNTDNTSTSSINEISKIYFQELEYLCRSFAKQYNLNTDDVIKEGLGKLKTEYPEIVEEAILNDNDIKKLNVQQLKDELKARNLRMTGNKTDLKQRLSEEMSRLSKLLV